MIYAKVKEHIPAPVRKTVRTIRETLNLADRYRRAQFKFLIVQHVRAIIHQFSVDLVIDVGANEGQFGLFMRDDVGYRGKLISFEPVASTFHRLAAAARTDDLWQAVNSAAGSAAGQLSINITRDSVFNSFRAPSPDNVFSNVNTAVSQELVDVHRLDEYVLAANIQARSIFLKADTQGFDRDVIRGASAILDRVAAIQTELSFIPIYDGMINYVDMINELETLGFAVSNMFPVTMTKLQAIEFDCFLVRKSLSERGEPQSYESLVLGTRPL